MTLVLETARFRGLRSVIGWQFSRMDLQTPTYPRSTCEALAHTRFMLYFRIFQHDRENFSCQEALQ